MQKHLVMMLSLLASLPLSAALSAPEQNLLSLGAGALVVQAPPSRASYEAFGLLDEVPSSGWLQLESGDVSQPFVFVFELSGKAEISALGFSSASASPPDSEAREVLVEIADAAKGPFAPLYKGSLKRRTDDQRVTVATPKTGRYLRLTLLSNYGYTEHTQLMDFAAFGRFTTALPVPKVTGSFIAEGYGAGLAEGGYALRLEQDGVTATGCYEASDGLIENGGFEGRVLRLNWRQSFDDTTHGPAVLIFRDDGKSFVGYRWKDGAVDDTEPYEWNGVFKNAVAGNCPHFKFKGKAGAGNVLASQLKKDGRVRLYGILFDTDSDVIKPESKPAIEALIAAAKGEGAMKLLIEGHTDSTGGAAHNAALSAKRAAAVKAALVAGGVNAATLSTQGFGDGKPVASNDTSLGRSQNRRVEVVSQLKPGS